MKKHSAFSLIEISVTILIIGILVAGVTQSSQIIKQVKLTAAASLTKSSSVAGIKDLLLWYETSQAASFDDSVQTDGAAITTWYDSNPQAASKNNATQTGSSSYRPLFKQNVFNGAIPGVRFDGIDDRFVFTGSDLIGTSFTIFVVEQRRTGQGNFFVGTNSNSNVYNGISLGYQDYDEFIFSTADGDAVSTFGFNVFGAYTTPISRIHTAILNIASGVTSYPASGKSYWLNGGADAPDYFDANNHQLNSYLTPMIGGNAGPAYYKGDLAEIIIFTRALKTKDRQDVETYLGKKYGITIL